MNNVPAIQVGDPASFVLSTTSASGGVTYSFNGFFTSFETALDVAGAVTFNGNFITNGIVTRGTNP